MSYFPKYYIKTNLYTVGGEYVIKKTGEDYSGYYWSTGNNRFYTGQTPNSNPIFEIVPKLINNGPDLPPGTEYVIYALPRDGVTESTPTNPYDVNIVVDYLTLKNINYQTSENIKILPSYNPNPPTQQDYQNGEFIRYFCKRSNMIEYIEINQSTFDSLVSRSPSIEWSLYIPFRIFWKLTGDKQQVYDINKNITLLAMKNQKLPSFDQYLKFDFTKY